MTGAHVKRRLTQPDKKTGKRSPRYLVYYREGSKFKERYAGSFLTKAEARIRRDLVAGEMAAGRDPADLLERLRNPPPPKAGVLEAYDEFIASRVDVKQSAKDLYRNSRDKWVAILGALTDPKSVTPRDIIDGVAALAEDLMPSSIRQYTSSLAQVFDFCDVEPNPVRSRKVRLPKTGESGIEVPSNQAWFAIRDHLKKRSRLPLRLVECCGFRISECCGIEWGDIDFAEGQILVRLENTKTAAGRRWMPVPAELLDEVAGIRYIEDRVPAECVFDLNPQQIRYDLEKACNAAGHGNYSPHELRHRRISLWIRHGFDAVRLSKLAGHSSASMSLDKYGHTIAEPQSDEWRTFWMGVSDASSHAAQPRHQGLSDVQEPLNHAEAEDV